MSNVEHLLGNALTRTKKAFENGESCREAFTMEMTKKHNEDMLSAVNLTIEELWDIVQYILFCWKE